MSYTVVWNTAATEAIDGSMPSASPEARKQTVDAIEIVIKALSENPIGVGESRRDQITRVIVSSPVTAHYRVIERLSIVRVFAARVYRSRTE